jgi:hypothetical protein
VVKVHVLAVASATLVELLAPVVTVAVYVAPLVREPVGVSVATLVVSL